jgi:hypothetical protein
MTNTEPKQIPADDAVVRLTEFIREVASLDDLAQLMSKYLENGPVQVIDENGKSDVANFSYGTTAENDGSN